MEDYSAIEDYFFSYLHLLSFMEFNQMRIFLVITSEMTIILEQ